jgi:hypothetical protein
VRGGGTEDEAPGAAGPAADTTDTSPQVAGDDPLAALPALLSRRTDCFRELSQLCLGDVDEPGSSALEADRVALAALQSQARQPVIISAEGAGIVERWGDSVIVALAPHSEPASLLLLKGEAGWRIRDYIAAPGD